MLIFCHICFSLFFFLSNKMAFPQSQSFPGTFGVCPTTWPWLTLMGPTKLLVEEHARLPLCSAQTSLVGWNVPVTPSVDPAAAPCPAQLRCLRDLCRHTASSLQDLALLLLCFPQQHLTGPEILFMSLSSLPLEGKCPVVRDFSSP